MKTAVQQHRLTDFEGISSHLPHWNYDLRQIEAGIFSGSMTQFKTEGLEIFHLTKNRVLEHRATTPEGVMSFLFLGKNSAPCCICKQKLDAYSMAVLQPGAEIKGISYAGISLYCMSVKKEQLENSADLYGVHLPDKLTSSTILGVLPTYLKDLEMKITRLFEDQTNADTIPLDNASLIKLEQELLSSLLLSISPKQQKEPQVTSSCKILEKSIDYFNEHLVSKLTIQEMCKDLQVCERTLQYAFKEHFGVSPVNYMRAIRLSKVFKELARSDASSVVICDVARKWGFNHMSQFTADYKKHFGELPSDTLAKAT